MSLISVGVSLQSMPIGLFERTTIQSDAMSTHVNELIERGGVAEAVILSTCTRTEVYACVEQLDDGLTVIQEYLAETASLDHLVLADYWKVRQGVDAVRHLLSVAAGLDSVVVGEHEILGQVRSAWKAARDAGSSGCVMNHLFRSALTTGKRVRSDTSIGCHPTSVPHAAIGIVESSLGSLKMQEVLIVGAGAMARRLVATTSNATGANVTITNRTTANAQLIATQPDHSVIPFANLSSALEQADVAFVAVSAPTLDCTTMTDVMRRRDGRSICLVDLSVPRSIEPTIGELAGVRLIDMAELRRHCQKSRELRESWTPAANAIIEDELDRYEQSRTPGDVASAIAALTQEADQIIESELRRRSCKLDRIDIEARELAECLVRGVVAKLLHVAIKQLRDTTLSEAGEELIESAVSQSDPRTPRPNRQQVPANAAHRDRVLANVDRRTSGLAVASIGHDDWWTDTAHDCA